jgi:hypothetical protein
MITPDELRKTLETALAKERLYRLECDHNARANADKLLDTIERLEKELAKERRMFEWACAKLDRGSPRCPDGCFCGQDATATCAARIRAAAERAVGGKDATADKGAK